MRGVLMFIVIAGVGGGLFVWQKQHEQKTAGSNDPAAAQKQSASANTALTPAPRGQASEHNWMKRSLDRAADVRDQARARTKEAQDP
jgi:Flp pilus assembly protein TadB